MAQFIPDENESLGIPKHYGDHSYGRPMNTTTTSTVTAEPLDAAVQVEMVSGMVIFI